MDHTRHVIGNKRNAPAKAKLRMHSGQQWTELKSDRRLKHSHAPVLCLEYWSQRTDLNRRPAVYKTAALPLSYVGIAGVDSSHCIADARFPHTKFRSNVDISDDSARAEKLVQRLRGRLDLKDQGILQGFY